MHKIKQILVFLDRGVSQRNIALQMGVNRRSVASYYDLAKQSNISLSELVALSDHELAKCLGMLDNNDTVLDDERREHLESLYPYFKVELRKIGVTKYLLWEEYIKDYPEGFKYSRFCELLVEFAKVNCATLSFTHKPGELIEVDFAGDKLCYIDKSTGEIKYCPVLVMILPFSGLSYVEALENSTVPQIIKALNNGLTSFKGASKSVISDNMKQWVRKINRYEPVFNETITQWATHYKINLLSTRPYEPTDKGSVENMVKITYRRVYAKLRKEEFYSLRSLNIAILEKLEEHHCQNFQKKTFSRRELFEKEERIHLQKLPSTSFIPKNYTKAKVQKNYHVVVGEDWHYYSVPYRFIGKEVKILYCTDDVEIYYGNERIATHKRNFQKNKFTTDTSHCPKNHQAHLESLIWNANDYLKEASKYGPNTVLFFQKVLESKPNIDHTYQSCLGLQRLAKANPERIEKACARALLGVRYNYMVIKNILENKMDILQDNTNDLEHDIIIPNTNIRGPEEYK
ncbi:IS21 family transposase [Myroides odoratimimus]|uniref:IS21 family transposase n=1 Tax=Myroides odoratimimus TaxID=76832 RepID=UPI003D2F8DE3